MVSVPPADRHADRAVVGELADLRPDAQIEPGRRQHGGHHRQADAELLELDGDGGGAVGVVAGDRDRELAAGQEARGLARLGGEVRLRQDGDQLIGRQRIDDGVDIPVAGVKPAPS